MINLIPDIQLSTGKILLVLLGCGWLVWYGHPEWAIGIYMSTVAWNRTIMFGPIAHTWVFLAVAVMAAISYILRKGSFSFVPPTDRWIVPFMGLWWVWMMILIGLLGNPGLRLQLARIFLCNIVAPLPIFLLFAGDVKRARGFAVAYILTTLVGGYVSLRMMEISNSMLLADPTLSSATSIHFLGLYNYHWFAYAQANSLIMTLALFQEKRGLVIRLALLLGAGACAYFLMLSGSRQSIICVFLAMSVFVWWIFRQRSSIRLLPFTFLVIAFLIIVLMYQQAPQLMRAQQLSVNEVLSTGMEERWGLWLLGLKIFANSPVWGTGFKDQVISHNLFISTLADQGIMGMLFLLGFLTFFIRQVRNVWQASGPKDLALWRMAFCCVALFGLCGSQVSGNVLSIFEVYWSTAFLWHLGWASKKYGHDYSQSKVGLPAGIVARELQGDVSSIF